MKTIVKSLVTLVSTIMIPIAAQASIAPFGPLVIDDFNDTYPGQEVIASSGGWAHSFRSGAQLSPAQVLGDSRYIYVRELGGGSGELKMSVGEGTADLNANSSGYGYAVLAYGYSGLPNNWMNEAPTSLHQDLTHYDRFLISMDTLDVQAGVNVTITVFSSGAQSFYSYAIPGPIEQDTSFSFPFSQFTGAANFADVNGITLKISFESSTDLTIINQFVAVPEPETYLAGIGALAMLGLAFLRK